MAEPRRRPARHEVLQPVVRLLARMGWLSACSTALRVVRRPGTLGWELALRRDARRFTRRVRGLGEAPAAQGPKRLLLLALDDGCLKAKIESVLARSLEPHGYEPVVLNYRWCRKSLPFYRALGVRRFAHFDDYLTGISGAELAALETEVDAQLAAAPDVQALKAVTFRGVHIGRAALSTVTRSLFKGRVDLDSPEVRHVHLRRWLLEAMRRVVAAERMFDDLRPDALMVNEKGYVAEAPVFEAALNRGINTMYWCHAHRDDALVLKRYTPETKHLQAFSLSEASWQQAQRIEWTPWHEAELAEEFRARYQNMAWWLTRRYQDGKQMKSPREVRRQIGLDPSKKTAVIFSHITWDASFFHGEDVFADFEEWLIETVKVACANPVLNWIIKLHPINVYKSKADHAPQEPSERAALRTRIGPLPPHVKLLEPDTDLNTFALFPVTDYCLTVRGTIGIEMACFGIPVLTAGTGRYAGLGFTLDSASRAEYLARLTTLQTQPRLIPEQVLRAKRYAYVLFRRRPARFTSFRTVFRETYPPGHPFFWDFELQTTTPEALAAAPDLAAFAAWAVHSQAADFLMREPRAESALEELALSASTQEQ